MKYIIHLLSLAILATASSVALGSDESPLYENMDQMQDAYRDLGRGLRRAGPEDIPDLLKANQELTLLAVQGKVMVPTKAESIPEAERAAFIVAYRLKMIETVRVLLDIEKALLNQDFERADELFDELKNQRSEGHEQFQEDY